jgi:hypothetical protein
MMLVIVVPFSGVAQEDEIAEEGEEEMLQPRRLIDAHTAGILPRAHFDFETRIYPSGDEDIEGCGLMMSISVGITDRLNIGVSYGGDGIVGRGKVRGNPYPGALIKYRIIEESFHVPGIAIGYDHQGYGGIETNNYKGYIYKSQGLFCALSKNYLLFRKLQLGIHGAINFTWEDIHNVKWPNGYIGIDLGFNEELAIALEYDLALNQKDRNSGSWANPLKGIFNIGIRWAIVPAFYIEFDAKDIFLQKIEDYVTGDKLGWSRELKIVYVTSF